MAKLEGVSPTALVLSPVGTSLHDRLLQPQYEEPAAAARMRILRQLLPEMLQALAHCHARGVLHDDFHLLARWGPKSRFVERTCILRY